MEVKQILSDARAIWGDKKLTIDEIIVRLGVDMGDVCRWARHADKDHVMHTDDELQKELGNIIFSVIRWCDDLGYDPEVCIERAQEAQRAFAKQSHV